MTDKSWKQAERDVASLLGARRNPSNGERREDISHPRLSVEVKHGAQIPKLIVQAMEQARRNAPDNRSAVVALHPKGSRRRYACVTAGELAALCPDLLLVMDFGDLASIIENEAETDSP